MYLNNSKAFDFFFKEGRLF